MTTRKEFEESYFGRTGSRLYCEAEYRGWQMAVDHIAKTQTAVVYAEFWPDGALKGYNEHAEELDNPQPLVLSLAAAKAGIQLDIYSTSDLTELEKDASNLLFALHDAWPYLHQWCAVDALKRRASDLIRKHGEYAELQDGVTALESLRKDAGNLLLALQDAAPYVQRWCTIRSKKERIQSLIQKHEKPFQSEDRAENKAQDQSDDEHTPPGPNA